MTLRASVFLDITESTEVSEPMGVPIKESVIPGFNNFSVDCRRLYSPGDLDRSTQP
jgi:hypothetical protein